MRAALELLVEEKTRAGMSRADARRAAAIELRIESVKEQVREVRAGAFIETLLQDVRYAARLLRRNPLFTLTAALSLAIGIGATTTVFTVANGLLLRSAVGVTAPDGLIDIVRRRASGEPGVDEISYPDYLEIRKRATTVDGVYAYQLALEEMSLRVDDSAERVFANLVTPNYFQVLGVAAMYGRVFGAGDSEQPGASPIAVLSQRFWLRRFDGDRSVVGRTVHLNGHPVTIVGVAREDFRGMTIVTPDLWLPTSMVSVANAESAIPRLTSRESDWLMLGARLKPGYSRAQASAEMSALGAALAREFPITYQFIPPGMQPADFSFTWSAEPSSPIPSGLRLPVAGFLALLMAIVAVVLAIACANLAGVLLARATVRRREIALRTAIGAGRARIVRQLLTETLLLFAARERRRARAGAAADDAARGVASVVSDPGQRLGAARCARGAVRPRPLPDGGAAVRPGAGAARVESRRRIGAERRCAGAPGSAASAERVRGRAGGVQHPAGGRRGDPRCVPSTACRRSTAASIPGNVDVASVNLSMAGYTDTSGPAFVRELVERVRALPGVQIATVADRVPGPGSMSFGGLTVPGVQQPPGQPFFYPNWTIVDSQYFATLRIPLVEGRDFTANDRAGGQSVAIVGEGVAKRFWPGKSAVGQYVVLHTGNLNVPNPPGTRVLIVGVVGDLKYGGPRENAPLALYVPVQQRYSAGLSILARTSGQRRLAGDLRALIASLNRNLPVLTAQTLESQQTGPVVTQLRIAATVAGSVGLVGLLLAAIGIYGVTAYTVTRRTREIGIRMSLGATRAVVVGMVLRRAMTLVVIGSAIGLLMGAGAGKAAVRCALWRAASRRAACSSVPPRSLRSSGSRPATCRLAARRGSARWKR